MKKRLRLFKIEVKPYTFQGVAVEEAVLYFDNKRLAKRERDRLHDDGKTDIVVMRGPDHKRGESFNVSQQMERAEGKKHARPVSARG